MQLQMTKKNDSTTHLELLDSQIEQCRAHYADRIDLVQALRADAHAFDRGPYDAEIARLEAERDAEIARLVKCRSVASELDRAVAGDDPAFASRAAISQWIKAVAQARTLDLGGPAPTIVVGHAPSLHTALQAIAPSSLTVEQVRGALADRSASHVSVAYSLAKVAGLPWTRTALQKAFQRLAPSA